MDGKSENLSPCAVQIFLLASIGTVVFLAIYPFRSAYFWLDDFNNLFWAERNTGWSLLRDLVNPASDSYRPLGMLVYWLLWRLFDLHPLPYHLLAWALHAGNTFLVYLLLRRLLQSDFAGAAGAMLFSFQLVYWDVFWNFGYVFDLLCGLFFFAGLWTYLRFGQSLRGMAWACGIYILGIRSKELAIPLPAIWLWYEVVGRKSTTQTSLGQLSLSKQLPSLRLLAERFTIPTILAVFFCYLKIKTASGIPKMVSAWFPYMPISTTLATGPNDPYYMSYSPSTFLDGYTWYLNALSALHLSTPEWGILIVILASLLLLFGDRLALFFLGYIFLSLLSVIPLQNHRFGFYWYIPWFGMCGLAASIVKRLSEAASKRIPPQAIVPVGALLFVLGCGLHFGWQFQRSQFVRSWSREMSEEYRSFAVGLRNLPVPPLNETLYYLSTPRYLDEATLLSTTQVILQRTDLRVRKVADCPRNARYCVRFENSAVMLEQPLPHANSP